MMRRPIVIFTATVLAAAGLVGCMGDPNANGPNTNDWDFTTERQAAVTDIVEQLVATGGALASVSSIADPRLDLENSAFGTFGTCPVVTYVSVGDSSTVTFDFGDGCTAALTGPSVVRGEVSLSPSLTDDAFRVRYNDLFIDNREVTGTLDPLYGTSDSDNTASINIDIDDVGDVRGTLEISFSDQGAITISGDDVRFDMGTDIYYVDLVNVIFDPPNNDNLIPKSGTITFRDNRLVAISVTFTERSAETGLVRVIVGNGSMQNFTPVTPP